MPGTPDYYELLGIPPDASDDDIRSAHRRAAVYWHPDRNKSPNAAEMMRHVNGARDTLLSATKKRDYNQSSSVYQDSRRQRSEAGRARAESEHRAQEDRDARERKRRERDRRERENAQTSNAEGREPPHQQYGPPGKGHKWGLYGLGMTSAVIIISVVVYIVGFDRANETLQVVASKLGDQNVEAAATPTASGLQATATGTIATNVTAMAVPTITPTEVPTAIPTKIPTATPTAVPTITPTAVPTVIPTSVPTATPVHVSNLLLGPVNGGLKHSVTFATVSSFDTGVSAKNFKVETVFVNPFSASARVWNHGFIFRNVNAESQLLIITGDGYWKHYARTELGDRLLDSGIHQGSPGAQEINKVTLIALDDLGYLFVNDIASGILDLSGAPSEGEISLVQGMFDDDEFNGSVTEFRDLKITEMNLEVDDPDGYLTISSDQLTTSNGSVNALNAVMTAEFLSPYPAFSGNWSFGFQLRRLPDGAEHYVVLTDMRELLHYQRTSSGVQAERVSKVDAPSLNVSGDVKRWLRLFGQSNPVL